MEIMELKITVTEINIALEGFHSRYELAEERISEHELYTYGFYKPRNQEKKERRKMKRVLKWITIKHTNYKKCEYQKESKKKAEK